MRRHFYPVAYAQQPVRPQVEKGHHAAQGVLKHQQRHGTHGRKHIVIDGVFFDVKDIEHQRYTNAKRQQQNYLTDGDARLLMPQTENLVETPYGGTYPAKADKVAYQVYGRIFIRGKQQNQQHSHKHREPIVENGSENLPPRFFRGE